jgi:FixJ family two-component response regulator
VCEAKFKVLEDGRSTEAMQTAASRTKYHRYVLRYNVASYLSMRRGLENAGIARELGIAENTVKNHLNSVFVKRNLKHRGQAILYYWGMWLWLERTGWSFDGRSGTNLPEHL